MAETKRTRRTPEEIRLAKIAALEEKKAFHLQKADEIQQQIDELNNPAPTMADITKFIKENDISLESVQKMLQKMTK